MLHVLKLYYKVASSQLPAPQILRVLNLYYPVASSHLPAPRLLRVLKLYYPVILPSHQFSSGHSPDTPRTTVVLRVLKLYYPLASSHLPTPQLLRVLKLYYHVASSQLPAPQLLRVLQLYYKVASSQLPAPQLAPLLNDSHSLPSRQFSSSTSPATPRTTVVLQSRQCSSSSSRDTPRTQVLPAHQFSSSHSPATLRTKVVLPSRQFSSSSSPATPRATVILQSRQCSSSSFLDTPRTQVVLPTRQFSSSHSPATPRTKVVLPSRQFSASSSPATPRTEVVPRSRQFSAFRALDTHDLRRGSRGHFTHRALACISRTRHARSPQRVARSFHTSRSRLHFAPSTRTISAEGCAVISQIALSPAFRALDTHDLRRGLRGNFTNRALACISRTRHVRSPQRVARAAGESHSRLHFAHSTRTISAEGCARSRQIALSPAFRALDTHDLRRGLRGHPVNRTLACISRTRHARSPQRVARAAGKSHSRLHFAHSTRTISAEGCTFG